MKLAICGCIHRLWAALLVLSLPVVLVAAEPTPAGGFFDLYQDNRATGVPHYITADLLLLGYSLIRQRTVAETEERRVIPLFTHLVTDLSGAITGEEPADTANREFLAVLNALLAGKTPDAKTAQAEWQLILEAKGISASPLWEMNLDYSQFKPRGRYTATPELANYFRAMRYAGAVLFAVKESQATGLSAATADRMTAQALRLAQALTSDEELATRYQELDELLSWQFGPGEDLRIQDLIAVAQPQTDAPPATVRAALLDQARRQQRQPRILAGIVDAGKLETGVTAADTLTGWRLLPARYSADSAVFQQLVYDRVGTYINDCPDCPPPFGLTLIEGKPVKGFPSAYELLALLGSAHAAAAVKQVRQDRFEGYGPAAMAATQLLDAAQGLTGAQFVLMRAWLDDADTASAQRRLDSLLGFWTWQRYLGVLYQKQSTTLTGKSLPKPEDRPGARLEPARELYLGLARLVADHRRMTPHPAWDRFAAVLDRCVALSRKRELQAGDEAFLNGLDLQLLELTGGRDQPIVVDVHTNPASGQVVEEGVGFAQSVMQDQARGALFTHYEFKQPLAERLDNAGWLEMLKAGKVPASPFAAAINKP